MIEKDIAVVALTLEVNSEQIGAASSSINSTGKEYVCLTRRNNLHNGIWGKITRPFFQLFDSNIEVGDYVLPGGQIDRNTQDNLFNSNEKAADYYPQCLLDKIVLSEETESYDDVRTNIRKIATASIQALIERTRINLHELVDEDKGNYSFRYLTKRPNSDAKTVHYFQLHIANIETHELKRLIDKFRVGRYTAAASILDIQKIHIDRRGNTNRFLVLPLECLKSSFLDNKRGVGKRETIVDNQPSLIPQVDKEDQYVEFDALNAQILFENCNIHSIGQDFKPDELRIEEFQKMNDAKAVSQIELHLPSQKKYFLKRVKPNSELDGILKKVSRDGRVKYKNVLSAKTANEFLASKLYELHGIRVPKLKTVVTGIGNIVASEYIEDFYLDNNRLRENPPEELFDGVGCDIAFGNYEVIGEDSSLLDRIVKSYNSTQIGFLRSTNEPVRLSLGGALAYTKCGLKKETTRFTERVEVEKLLSYEVNPSLNLVFKRQLEINPALWERVIYPLEKITDGMRRSYVHKYGGGTHKEKEALAELINKRVKNTISECKKVAAITYRLDRVEFSIVDDSLASEQILLMNEPGDMNERLELGDDIEVEDTGAVVHDDNEIENYGEYKERDAGLLGNSISSESRNEYDISQLKKTIQEQCIPHMIKLSLSEAYDHLTERDTNNNTLFHYAALSCKNTLEIFQLIVGELEASLNTQLMFTPCSDEQGSDEAIQKEICYILESKNKDGYTPLILLQRNSDNENFEEKLETIEYLFHYGVSLGKSLKDNKLIKNTGDRKKEQVSTKLQFWKESRKDASTETQLSLSRVNVIKQ